ncbi:MAG: hypothetical protein KIS66_17570 [Fimbriimonadaceae bacterium]|nr:hypothetical protein [Fimbriimonadaceae bacterium]
MDLKCRTPSGNDDCADCSESEYVVEDWQISYFSIGSCSWSGGSTDWDNSSNTFTQNIPPSATSLFVKCEGIIKVTATFTNEDEDVPPCVLLKIESTARSSCVEEFQNSGMCSNGIGDPDLAYQGAGPHHYVIQHQSAGEEVYMLKVETDPLSPAYRTASVAIKVTALGLATGEQAPYPTGTMSSYILVEGEVLLP